MQSFLLHTYNGNIRVFLALSVIITFLLLRNFRLSRSESEASKVRYDDAHISYFLTANVALCRVMFQIPASANCYNCGT